MLTSSTGQELDQLPLDFANQMSLFFAHATPMLNALSDVVGKFVADANVATSTTETLCVMAKVRSCVISA